MWTRYWIGVVALAMTAGCQHAHRDAFTSQFAGSVERAHHAEIWRAQQAVQADITVTMLGQQVIDGNMIFTTDGKLARLDQLNGGSVVFDGLRAWVTPAYAPLQDGRHHVRTWTYLAALPMHLADPRPAGQPNAPGTHLTDLGLRKLGDRSYYASRLTFDPGARDTHNDWFILYADLKTHRLAAAAYIDTHGRTVEEAQRHPQAVVFEDFRDVEGVVLATRWVFYAWNETDGIHGEPIGAGRLTNIRFVTPLANTFLRPEDARLDPAQSQ